MTVIEVKADIVDNDTGKFYDWIGWDAVYPGKVSTLLDGADEVEVNINSNGGDVFAASEIYTLLSQHSGMVTVNIQGLAASAASVIAMAGDVVHISPTAQIMIHKAWTIADGNADDMAHTSEFLEGIDDSIMNAYVAKTGLDKSELSNMMAKETWLTANQAVDYGFADDVMDFGRSKEPVLNSIGYPQVSRAVVDRWKKAMASAEAYEKQKKTAENRDAEIVGKKKLQAKINLLF
ncbi:head maturation protease, ClpP-related [Ligilactobacillus ruminis]|uniref:head maturation protease, ClpP-related n=1 Tax=Ligilactobacillus ruminis TaxID=1623 RepID=UPI0022E19D8C|nr:head maturation protease, ClpP-related [Ligilactobacillus ruminis]